MARFLTPDDIVAELNDIASEYEALERRLDNLPERMSAPMKAAFLGSSIGTEGDLHIRIRKFAESVPEVA